MRSQLAKFAVAYLVLILFVYFLCGGRDEGTTAILLAAALPVKFAFFAFIFFICYRLVSVAYIRKPRPPGTCRTCGYNLTGNTTGICPECGSPTKLHSHK